MTLTLWKDLSVRREVRKHLMSGDEEAKKAAAVKASSLEAKGGGHLKPAALKNFYNHAWLPKRKVFWCRLVPPTSPSVYWQPWKKIERQRFPSPLLINRQRQSQSHFYLQPFRTGGKNHSTSVFRSTILKAYFGVVFLYKVCVLKPTFVGKKVALEEWQVMLYHNTAATTTETRGCNTKKPYAEHTYKTLLLLCYSEKVWCKVLKV